jgi:hypothetical protein
MPWAVTAGRAACQFELTLWGLSVQTDSVDMGEIITAVGSGDPGSGLRASVALHRLAERLEADQVRAARMAGWSWQQIGDALGITRQSVHAKHGKELP